MRMILQEGAIASMRSEDLAESMIASHAQAGYYTVQDVSMVSGEWSPVSVEEVRVEAVLLLKMMGSYLDCGMGVALESLQAMKA